MADDRDDLAPGDRHQLTMLAGEPYGEPVHPDAERTSRDRAGDGERATDEEVEAIIQEVLNNG